MYIKSTDPKFLFVKFIKCDIFLKCEYFFYYKTCRYTIYLNTKIVMLIFDT